MKKMKRTNIYLEEEQLRLLKHIAVEEGLSFTELVRRALQHFLESYGHPKPDEWNRRLDSLLTRVEGRTRAYSPEEIEADETAASEEQRKS